MKQLDHDDFKDALTQMFAAFGKEPFELQIRAYWKALEPHPLERVRNAMLGATRKGKDFPPTAGKISEICEAFAKAKPQANTESVCAFTADGDRCTLRGHYGGSDAQFCEYHWDHRNDRNLCRAFLHKVLHEKPVYQPSGSLCLLARNMPTESVLRDPLLGQEMVDYLAAHPIEETHPQWAEFFRSGPKQRQTGTGKPKWIDHPITPKTSNLPPLSAYED